MTIMQLRDVIVSLLAAELRVDPASIDTTRPFVDMGLDSESTVRLSGSLQREVGRDLSPTIAYDYPTIMQLAAGLCGQPSARATSSAQDGEPIAIVGIGCRFPGSGPGAAAFLEFLLSGADGVAEIPETRWDNSGIYNADTVTPGQTCTKWAGLITDLDRFDAGLFGILPVEAELMDPQQRLLLETSWHALEDAGYAPREIAGSATGVFIGISVNEYGDRISGDPSAIVSLTPAASALSIAANRISYFLDLNGPSMAIDTACSSSLSAVHLACQSLRAGETSLALAGGVNAVLKPDVAIAFTQAGLMSRDGRCKTFAATADGYVRGEGAGVVVLKRMSDATRDGNEIYALILGSAAGQDGRSNGLMAPRGTAQEAIIASACARAGIVPADLDYVEAHGTGTAVGDVLEANAIGNVAGRGRTADTALLVGSVKSNIGHLESAAGIAGLIKTALSIRHAVLPPNLHFAGPNPAIDFAGLGLRVVDQTTAWPDRPQRTAGVSSFGFGGANVHVVLRNAPIESPPAETASQAPILLALSAVDVSQLRVLAGSVADDLDRRTADGEAERAIKAMANRQAHHSRVAITGASVRDVVNRARSFAAGDFTTGTAAGTATRRPQLAYVFSGQGAMWPGASRDLFDANHSYREMLIQCDQALRPHLGRSILPALFGSTAAHDLEATELAQPALFAVQMGLTAVLSSWGMTPTACVGHSAGEVAAACFAGRLTLDEGARLIGLRGASMAPTRGFGCMIAVHAAEQDVRNLIAPWSGELSIAAVNAPSSTVVSGEIAAMTAFLDLAQAASIDCMRLPLDYAFHSHQMSEAAETIGERVGLSPNGDERCRFYSGVRGSRSPESLDGVYWRDNVREPVRFADAIAAMVADGAEVFLEIAPHSVLSRDIVAVAARPAHATMRRSKDACETMLAAAGAMFVAGVLPDVRLVVGAASMVETPPYPMAQTRFWINADEAGSGASHRLLDEPRPLAFDQNRTVQDGRLDLRRMPSLADHRIHGDIVFPASGVIELFHLAAATQLRGASVALHDVNLRETLTLRSGEALPIQVSMETGPMLKLTLFQRSVDGWTACADASAIAREQDVPGKMAVDGIRSRCFDIFPAPIFYELLEKRGLRYGRSFQGVTEVMARHGEALARLIPLAPGQTVLSPAVLDSCLHPIAAAMGAKQLLDPLDRTFLIPTSVREIVIHSATRQPCWSHCLIKERDKTSVLADVTIASEDGEILAELRGVLLRSSGAEYERKRDLTRALSAWFYDQAWAEIPAAATPTSSPHHGAYLVLCDSQGQGDIVIEALHAQGHRAVRVDPAAGFATVAPDHYQVLPGSADDLRRLFKAYRRDHWAGFIDLWPLEAVIGTGSIDDAIRFGPGSLTALVQAVEDSGLHGDTRLTVVTRNADCAIEGDKGCPLQALTTGLARAISIEHPNLACRRVDLDNQDLATSAELILGEALGDGNEDQLAYRGAARYAPRLRARRAAPAGPPTVQASAVYLITGGWGALGLIASGALIAEGATKLVLAGRTSPSPSALAMIDRWRASGIDVRVEPCDVTDAGQVSALVTRLCDGAAPLKGVIHTAGVLDDGAIMQLSAERLGRVVGPKLGGAINLHAATAGIELDFFVLYSSAVSVLGAPGQGNYCSANAALDAFARWRCEQGLICLSVGWAAWSGVGMASESASRMMSSTLVEMISPETGADILTHLLGAERGHRLIVPFSIPSLVQFYPSTRGMALFSEIMAGRLGELRSDTANRSQHDRPELTVPYVEPSSAVEITLAAMWQRSLGMKQVGLKDDLFELGGDSVFASQILSLVNETYGIRLEAQKIFEDFTIEHLALLVEEELLRLVSELDDADLEILESD